MRLPDMPLADLRDMADLTVLVASAHEAGIFAALADVPATSDDLARRLGFDERATRITLLALAESGLLHRSGDTFTPSPRCRAELAEPGGPDYVGGGLALWLDSIRAWSRLGEVLVRGGPLEARSLVRSPKSVARFMAAMAAAPQDRIDRIVALCRGRHPEANSILDVGGGPGHMTRAFIDRGLRGTLFDTAEVLDHVEDAYGLNHLEGLTLAPGDFTADPLPPGPFDLVLLSNVLHIYGPDTNRALLRKTAGVLPVGGVVAVVEFLRGRSGKAARFGVQMLIKSDEGDAYSEAQISAWLTEVGFEDVRVDDLDADRQLMTARKG
jgi:SAM-dependent methyltransferase